MVMMIVMIVMMKMGLRRRRTANKKKKKTMIRASFVMLAMLAGLRRDVDAGANPKAYTRSSYTLMLATRFWDESKGF